VQRAAKPAAPRYGARHGTPAARRPALACELLYSTRAPAQGRPHRAVDYSATVTGGGLPPTPTGSHSSSMGDTQMQKLQQGFTLIELMIVVAIIGILAALAVPAYQDYTIRSKVSEAASLASAVRTAVDVYFSENGTLPGSTVTNTSLGLSAPASYVAKYVASVNAISSPPGDILITLKTLPELGSASAKAIRYVPIRQGGNLQWTIATTGTTVPDKYKPRT